MRPLVRDKLLTGAVNAHLTWHRHQNWWATQNSGRGLIIVDRLAQRVSGLVSGNYHILIILADRFTPRKDGSTPESVFELINERADWWVEPTQLKLLQSLDLLHNHNSAQKGTTP